MTIRIVRARSKMITPKSYLTTYVIYYFYDLSNKKRVLSNKVNKSSQMSNLPIRCVILKCKRLCVKRL